MVRDKKPPLLTGNNRAFANESMAFPLNLMNPLPDHSSIRFGVNYVPSDRWWFCWNAFEPEAIARDLDAIAELGADHIRIMLIWPFFQPNRRWISECHLDRLDQLMELAAERRIDVCPALLTGWLSGWAFRTTFDRQEGFYAAEKLREPVERYFRACADRLNRHPNFLGFDLGNEMNCCWKSADVAEADAWMEWIMDLCESLSPQAVHVNGADHQPWFYPATFSAHKLARRQRLIAIHCWIEFTKARKRGGALDRVCTHLAPAMAVLARAHAGDPGKPVWLQEFGASSSWMEEDKIPAFLEAAVHAAVAGGICRLTWWASHDIRPEFEFAELEYDLGLITTDNRLKPSGHAFQRMIREYRGKPVQIPANLKLPPPPESVPGGLREESAENTWKWLEEVQRTL
jgi:endo-1,4-beta-mannosidase